MVSDDGDEDEDEEDEGKPKYPPEDNPGYSQDDKPEYEPQNNLEYEGPDMAPELAAKHGGEGTDTELEHFTPQEAPKVANVLEGLPSWGMEEIPLPVAPKSAKPSTASPTKVTLYDQIKALAAAKAQPKPKPKPTPKPKCAVIASRRHLLQHQQRQEC